jgi:hypothetical protein
MDYLIWLAKTSELEQAQRKTSMDSDLSSAVIKFFRLAWLGHRWTIEELVLNTDVVFYGGLSKVPWATLHMAFKVLSDYIWSGDLGAEVHRTLANVMLP